MMKEVKKDKLVSNNMSIDDYSKLYSQSDENIYLDSDFKGKDVLSVVSSGNQKFIQKLLVANSVDGSVDFDINILTKYYYYMRKWAIKYNNQIYPYGDRNYLKRLLDVVEVSDKNEGDAYTYWNYICNSNINIDSLFCEDVVSSGNQKFIQKLLVANSVDGSVDFDINILTKYYYYMRKWAIKYNNQIYPYGDRNYLKRLLDVVEVSDKNEGDAYTYWNYICNSNINIDSLFCEDDENELDIFKELFELEDYGSNKEYTYKKIK